MSSSHTLIASFGPTEKGTPQRTLLDMARLGGVGGWVKAVVKISEFLQRVRKARLLENVRRHSVEVIYRLNQKPRQNFLIIRFFVQMLSHTKGHLAFRDNAKGRRCYLRPFVCCFN